MITIHTGCNDNAPGSFLQRKRSQTGKPNLMRRTPVPAGFLRSGYADFDISRAPDTQHRKIKQLLNFLKEETYSDFKTLMLLFGFRDHKSLYSLLAKTEKMGLIQKHVLESRTMKISLWGITSDGLAVVLTPDDKIFPARFEPFRITGWTLEHHLDNQAARLILEKKVLRDGLTATGPLLSASIR
jgi:hypothetical protein